MTSPTGLDLGCEGRKIIARYLPGDPAAAPTRDALQALLVQQKWHTAALDEVAVRRALAWLRIESRQPLCLNLDGEPVQARAFHIECVAQRLRMKLPADCPLLGIPATVRA